ncbi:MAG TPA: hypothetical protein VL463_33580 [Kofleriaceae bacterium]|nr:hypothetical protein [Kofleriaceae bacterium]
MRADPAIAAAYRAMWRSRRVIGWAVALAAMAVTMTRLPLFGVLGYEHAFAVGVVMSAAGLDLGAAFARRARTFEAPALARAAGAWRPVVAIAIRAVSVSAAVSLIPAVIAGVHGLWAPTCDWGFGIRAELLLPVMTAIVAGGAGAAIGLVTKRAWACAVACVALWIVVALAAAWRFYSEPPVFFYDAIVGFFPGNLYDQDVTLGWPLIWSRLEQLAAVAAMLAAAAALIDAPTLRPRRERRPSGFRTAEVIACAVLTAAAALLHVEGGALGYAIDAGDIEAELDGVKLTPHFVIHYVRRPDIEKDIELIAADHEFRYAQVVRALGVEVDGRIDSYLFADSDQKARLMGARTVEMAKPWQRAIFLSNDAFPQPALRHEIAHVVAGEFGDPILHLAARYLFVPNPGLVEGLAVAVDWPGSYDWLYTPDQNTRVMGLNGVEPSIGTLFGLGFLSQSSGRAYLTAGSFVHYLLARYGAPSMRALYRSAGDFEGTYGKSRAQLEAEWRAMIDAITVPPEAIATGKESFRRGSVFDVPCPHAIAARRARAIELAGEGDREGAIAITREVCTDDPDEPRHQLDLAALLSTGDDAEQKEAKQLRTKIAHDDAGVTAPLRAEALQDLGEDAGTHGDFAGADALFTQALALPIDGGARRQLEAMRFALRHEGPSAPLLRAYFFAPGDHLVTATLVTSIEPQLGLGWYLRGLQEIGKDDHASAAADLSRALSLGLPSPRFVSNAARKLATSAWRAGDHAKVAQAADVLAGTGNEIERLLAEDWRERIEWTVTGKLPAITSR